MHTTIILALSCWIGGIAAYLVYFAMSSWLNQYRTRND